MAKVIAKHKEAHFNYEFLHKFEAGIVLSGWEVKSIRSGKVNLKGSFCTFKDKELYVSNIHISKYMDVSGDETAPRKLLLHKHEIKKLSEGVKVKGHSIVPVTLKWSSKGYLKLDIALGKGKNKADKREVIKKRDAARLNKKYMGM